MATATTVSSDQYHLARTDGEASGVMSPVPDRDGSEHHEDRHRHVDQVSALVGEHHGHQYWNESQGIEQPGRTRRQPGEVAHAHDGEADGGGLVADGTEALKRQQGQVGVDGDVPDRHEVDERGTDDAQHAEFVQIAPVEVLAHRHPGGQCIATDDVQDVLPLENDLGERIVVQFSLDHPDHEQCREGQPETRRQSDPLRGAPGDQASDQCERDVDLGQTQLRRAGARVEQPARDHVRVRVEGAFHDDEAEEDERR